MSYADRETSRYGGAPLECYRFIQGDNDWKYTSADSPVTLPGGVFEPETITRSEPDFSSEDRAETLTITVPRTNPVPALFIGNLPSTPIWVFVYRAHREDETDEIALFSGKVERAVFKGSEVELIAASTGAVLNRSCPPLMMQTPCNHMLYSAECGANPNTCHDEITVTTVDGVTVTSNDFALRDDGWFAGGRIVTAGNETRFIAAHIGDTITLMSPCPGLESLSEILAYWGCDHLEATCAAKFDNRVNHCGWSRLPGRNPFRGRIT